MPERLRAQRAGIDRLLQHVVAGVVGDAATVHLDRTELWTLLDALPIAILISTDRACSRILGNAAARRLYQLPEGQNLSRTAASEELPPFEVFSDGKLTKPDDLPLQTAARTGLPVAQSECEIRFADGRRIFIAGHSIPVRDQFGQVCGSIGAFIDLTPQRREFELLQAVAQEMSHRLKNTLTIIQSISRRTLKPNVSAETYAAYEDRLVLLSKYQDLLHQREWRSPTVAQVVALSLDVLTIGGEQRVTTCGADVALSAAAALTLSMIVHELATNALKYGALSVPDGRLAVSWQAGGKAGAQTIAFDWRESGASSVAEPASCGFGMSMMASIARALPGGQFGVEFLPTGLSASLSFRDDASL